MKKNWILTAVTASFLLSACADKMGGFRVRQLSPSNNKVVNKPNFAGGQEQGDPRLVAALRKQMKGQEDKVLQAFNQFLDRVAKDFKLRSLPSSGEKYRQLIRAIEVQEEKSGQTAPSFKVSVLSYEAPYLVTQDFIEDSTNKENLIGQEKQINQIKLRDAVDTSTDSRALSIDDFIKEGAEAASQYITHIKKACIQSVEGRCELLALAVLNQSKESESDLTFAVHILKREETNQGKARFISLDAATVQQAFPSIELNSFILGVPTEMAKVISDIVASKAAVPSSESEEKNSELVSEQAPSPSANTGNQSEDDGEGVKKAEEGAKDKEEATEHDDNHHKDAGASEGIASDHHSSQRASDNKPTVTGAPALVSDDDRAKVAEEQKGEGPRTAEEGSSSDHKESESTGGAEGSVSGGSGAQ
ncbi:MAG: hypothetical protein D6797_02070 [Bdellovibrio sp.]|nr:MAG: hypothetical protein D6797_02070 [Bdellovibrio sp.]